MVGVVWLGARDKGVGMWRRHPQEDPEWERLQATAARAAHVDC